MKQHVRILAVLYIALGSLKVVAALFAFVVILAGGLLSGDQTALLATYSYWSWNPWNRRRDRSIAGPIMGKIPGDVPGDLSIV